MSSRPDSIFRVEPQEERGVIDMEFGEDLSDEENDLGLAVPAGELTGVLLCPSFSCPSLSICTSCILTTNLRTHCREGDSPCKRRHRRV